MSKTKDLTLEQISELMRIFEGDTLEYQRLQRIFRNKQYLEQEKEIMKYFQTLRRHSEHLIFVTPSPAFNLRVSNILKQSRRMDGKQE